MPFQAAHILFAGLALSIAFSPLAARAENATAILVLEPVRSDGRLWDFGPAADPVLCLKTGCYRSAGTDQAAVFFPGHTALTFGNAGACTNSLICVFRHIDVDAVLTSITPIDVDVIRHDGLEQRLVSPDPSCALEQNELHCAGGTYTSEYSLWLVPDAIADAAGPDRLQAAADQGLTVERANAAAHFLASELHGLPDAARDFYQRVLAAQISETCNTDPSVILATFELTGLVQRHDQAMLRQLRRYLDITGPRDMRSFIAGDPRGFWRLHDAIDRLHLFASAERIVRIGYDAGGMALVAEGGQSVLRVDPEVEARARAVIDRCQDGLDVWSGHSLTPDAVINDTYFRPSGSRKQHPPLTPIEVSKRIAKSLPRIDPDSAAQRSLPAPKSIIVHSADQKKSTVDLDAETIRSIIGLKKVSLK